MSIRQIPWSVLQRLDGMRGGRFYVGPEGQRLPSVTNILSVIAKPALINWAANTERELVIEAAANLYSDLPADPKVPRMKRDAFVRTLTERIGREKAHARIAKKATDIGGEAHKLIEWNLRKELGQQPGPEPRIQPAAAVAFAAFEAWWKGAGLRVVRVEQMVFHPRDLYAGTLDVMAVDSEDRLGIVDFKTSKGIYLEYLLQVRSYGDCVDAMGHGPVEWAKIARFSKDEKAPEFDPVRDIQDVPMNDQLLNAFRSALLLHRWLQDNDPYIQQQIQKSASPVAAPAAVDKGVTAGNGATVNKAAAGDTDSPPAVRGNGGATGVEEPGPLPVEPSNAIRETSVQIGPPEGATDPRLAAAEARGVLPICEAIAIKDRAQRLLREAGIHDARTMRARVLEVLNLPPDSREQLSDVQMRDFCTLFAAEADRLKALAQPAKIADPPKAARRKKGVAA